ncbi:MAG TPA: hypothetical protein VF691_12525, partial [Cytophagaceae bacterium]
MENTKSIISGVVGALVLTGLHQTIKKVYEDAPRVDLLGMQAIAKIMKEKTPEDDKLYGLSLAGDLIFNSFNYSLVGLSKSPVQMGAIIGFGTGLATAYLPGPLGLNDDLSSRNSSMKALSIGYYFLGG